MKIFVILTGGTIASAEKGGVISPSVSPLERLVRFYSERHGFDLEFESVSPYTVLSEDLSAEYLNRLAECAAGAVGKGYEKIMICHGTDTLQYSAAALSYLLAGKNCCAVLVSAGKPLDAPDSNGFDNFCAAAEFLKYTDLHGTFVSYKNNCENAKILSGTGLELHREADDSLHSIRNTYAAEYDGGQIAFNSEFFAEEIMNVPQGAHFTEYSDIQTVCAVPGERYTLCPAGTKAVILRPYHSGTLNTQSKAFCRFCSDAKKRNIPVFAVNIRPGAQYESSSRFEELGIVPLENAAFAETYIKIWLSPERGGALKSFMLNA